MTWLGWSINCVLKLVFWSSFPFYRFLIVISSLGYSFILCIVSFFQVSSVYCVVRSAWRVIPSLDEIQLCLLSVLSPFLYSNFNRFLNPLLSVTLLPDAIYCLLPLLGLSVMFHSLAFWPFIWRGRGWGFVGSGLVALACWFITPVLRTVSFSLLIFRYSYLFKYEYLIIYIPLGFGGIFSVACWSSSSPDRNDFLDPYI